MAAASLQARVRKIIRDNARLGADTDALDSAADLYRAGMTSHASVAVMLALENEFDIEFPDALLSRNVFESIDSIVNAIETVQQETR